MIGASALTYSLIGGILPALVWLYFWLREDRKHPEPKGIILKTFLFGMISVLIVLPFQKGIDLIFPGTSFLAIVLWIILEEFFKLCAAYFGGIHTREDNEPIDPIIYMITAALGFVALENTLFLLGPLIGEEVGRSIITGNLRFIGASLLHVVASGVIGVAMALSFYKNSREKMIYISSGLIIAVIFHTIFNLSILNWGNTGTLFAFGLVWISVIFLLLAFEKSKTIARKNIEGYNK